MNNLITGNVKYFSQTENRNFINLMRTYKPFTDEEEREIFTKYKATGDLRLRNKIVLHNQRWVYSLAKQYARDEVEVMDYVSEGNIGLIEAIERFDINQDFKFITYAVWYIRRSMNMFLTNMRDSLTKSNASKIAKKGDRIKNEYLLKYGRVPSIDEMKEELLVRYDIKIVDNSDLYDLNIQSISDSIDEEFEVEDTDLYISKTKVDNECLEKEEKEYAASLVFPLLNKLGETEREIIMKLYNIGEGNENYTFAQVCEEYGLYEEGLQDLQKKILRYMEQTLMENRKHEKKVG